MAVQMQPSDLTRADQDAIRNAVARFVELALARDFQRLVDELTTEDVVFLPPDHPICDGRSATLAYLNEYPVMESFEAPVAKVQGHGNLAIAQGTYDITADIDGTPTRLVGKWLSTYRRTADGWRVTHDTWNSDAPPS